jgi:hypothetical protein
MGLLSDLGLDDDTINNISNIGSIIDLINTNDAVDQTAIDAQAGLDAALNAAKPYTVFDPLGSAVFNDETDEYTLGMNPLTTGMFTQGLQDVQRFREQAAPYMKDPEAAARQRYREDLAAVEPGLQDANQQMMSKLNTRGMMGSSIGAGIAAKQDRENAIKRSQMMSSARTGVQSDIDTYLARQQKARADAIALAESSKGLADIGSGIGSNVGGVAKALTPGVTAAQTTATTAGAAGTSDLINTILGLR